MNEEPHFITTNQLSFIDHSAQKTRRYFATSLTRAVNKDMSLRISPNRENSQSIARSKSPAVFTRHKSNLDITAAGVQRMNSSLYSQPWTQGKRNNKFKHPNLQSNLVFYETSPNMRDVEENRFQSTSRLMHSLGSSKFTVMHPDSRKFLINGKIAERITRQNNSNVKNRS